MECVAALYSFCLRRVSQIWKELSGAESPRTVQAGTATVFRHAVRYVPIRYLQGDPNAADDETRARVERILELYKQALQLSAKSWSKLGCQDPDTIQAGAATILIQYLQVSPPFEFDEQDEVKVSDTPHAPIAAGSEL